MVGMRYNIIIRNFFSDYKKNSKSDTNIRKEIVFLKQSK